MFFRSSFFIALLVLLSPEFILSQPVVINEVMASNARSIADEDGDNSDWLELYNAGYEAVTLAGYGLSDDLDNPFKWVFQDVTIDPGKYLLVWASGKDRHPGIGQYASGLIRDVYTGITGSSVRDLTNHPKYPDNPDSSTRLANLFEAPTNVGDHYGQRVHGWIKAPRTGLYTFWISGDDNCQLYISPNASPEGARLIAQVPGWTNPREWEKYTEQQSSTILLTEGLYYYVMALMKEHEGGDNLAVGWQMPGGVLERPISADHLFSGELQLHTNFSISAAGESITLTDPDGNLVSEMAAVAIPTDISYGRKPDGGDDWFFFELPTPGESNHTQGYTAFLDPPVFSAPAGFYSSAFDLSITHPDEEVQIIYTIDGSIPDTANLDGLTYVYKNQYPQYAGGAFGPFLQNIMYSRVYSQPLQVTNMSAAPNRLTNISTTWHNSPNYFPAAPVRKGLVVRARAVKPGAISSHAVTSSYFVMGQAVNPYTLPVISLTVQEDALFDYYQGIFVAGQVFDNWRTNTSGGSADGGTTANYWLSGESTERQAYVEYFETGHQQAALSQDIGIRVHGGWSRAHPLKSLRLYARSEYGHSTLDYPFFKERADNSYKRLVLRNSGNDFPNSYFRDAAIHRIMAPLHFDTQAYQPAVMFLNGEYWGIHNVRERYDKHYLARVYGVDPDNIDLLEVNASIIEGDNSHYNDMLSFIANNPIANLVHYEEVTKRMDVVNFADYQIANIFAANTDWPGNNIKYWRHREQWSDYDVPYGHDGRWRWLMYDTDFGFGFIGMVNHNTMQFATASNVSGWPNPSWSTLLFRRLLENASFRRYFINRFADLLNTAFLPNRMVGIIRDMQQALEPEMPEHHARWRVSAGGNMNAWNSQVNTMINFSGVRASNVRTHLRAQFSISDLHNVVVNVNDAKTGYIRINTIDITQDTPGVSENPYPWTGIYFQGIPIEVEAVAREGFVFSHWEGDNTGRNPLLRITPSRNINLKAHFTRYVPEGPQVLHYWHFNDLVESELDTVYADYSLVGPALAYIVYPGSGSGYMDRVAGTMLNVWKDYTSGFGLRTRNPSNTRALIIKAPSTGYRNLNLSFAVQRTANGASQQSMFYSIDGGTVWTPLSDSYPVQTDYALQQFDLSSIQSVNSNGELRFMIEFAGDEAATDSGNNRFDNIILTGIDIETSASNATGGDASTNLYIYPNPVINAATVTFDLSGGNSFLYLDVLNISGGVVDRYTEIPGSESIISLPLRVNGLIPGIYWIRLVTAHETAIKQIIIMR